MAKMFLLIMQFSLPQYVYLFDIRLGTWRWIACVSIPPSPPPRLFLSHMCREYLFKNPLPWVSVTGTYKDERPESYLLNLAVNPINQPTSREIKRERALEHCQLWPDKLRTRSCSGLNLIQMEILKIKWLGRRIMYVDLTPKQEVWSGPNFKNREPSKNNNGILLGKIFNLA